MTFRSVAELAVHPELMAPPQVVAPPVGVAGRVALVTLPPKGGKSTTLAGVIADASRSDVPCGLITLDEAPADSLQRLVRLGVNQDLVYLEDEFHPDTLAEEVATLGLQVLGLDHLGKLAERSPDFGPNSQGDPILWGRLVAPFTTLARELNLAVVLVDQARRSDGKYAGSYAKAGTVDVLCELQPKDGGLAGTPRGRITLPPFRVDLDEAGRPVFTDLGDGSRRLGRPPTAPGDRLALLAALQSAEPEGLRTTQWQTLARERASIPRSTFFELRRDLHRDGLVSYASRLYRVTGVGERALAALNGGANGYEPL